MPVIQCDIREGRSPEQKQAMADAITRAVHETIGAPVARGAGCPRMTTSTY